MFTRGMWYTPQEIIKLKYEDDIVFIDGLSFTDQELLEDWDGIHLRFYAQYQEENYLMFTILEGGE